MCLKYSIAHTLELAVGSACQKLEETGKLRFFARDEAIDPFQEHRQCNGLQQTTDFVRFCHLVKLPSFDFFEFLGFASGGRSICKYAYDQMRPR